MGLTAGSDLRASSTRQRRHRTPTKIEDAKNAVTFLAGHDKINADRLAAVGVCAGGGYAPAAAVADRHIKAVATASGLPHLRATIKAAGDWQSIMAAAGNAREQYAPSGCPTHIPFLADGELDLWRENAKKFHLTDRNHDPNWRNETLLCRFHARGSAAEPGPGPGPARRRSPGAAAGLVRPLKAQPTAM